MHKEKGYFCSIPIVYEMKRGEVRDEIWYGPRVDERLPEQTFESMATNGLRTFPTYEEAEQTRQELIRTRGETAAEVGYIDMERAETIDDWYDLRDNGTNLVILYDTFLGGTEILGPNTTEFDKSTIYPVEAERFTINGYQTFPAYPKWVYGEAARQGGKPNLATIVVFEKPVINDHM